jgi:hypothetical protein
MDGSHKFATKALTARTRAGTVEAMIHWQLNDEMKSSLCGQMDYDDDDKPLLAKTPNGISCPRCLEMLKAKPMEIHASRMSPDWRWTPQAYAIIDRSRCALPTGTVTIMELPQKKCSHPLDLQIIAPNGTAHCTQCGEDLFKGEGSIL